jgi:hypothetical protein
LVRLAGTSGETEPKIVSSLSDNGILYTDDMRITFGVNVIGGRNTFCSPSKTAVDVLADAMTSSVCNIV